MGKAVDTHHLCYPRKRWNKGLARELRYHWYMRVEIPKDTLHRDIHEAVSGVPLPDPKEIKRALHRLDRLKECGAISDNDSIEKRLAIIVPMFSVRRSGGAESAFRHQLDVVSAFYHRTHSRHRKKRQPKTPT